MSAVGDFAIKTNGDEMSIPCPVCPGSMDGRLERGLVVWRCATCGNEWDSRVDESPHWLSKGSDPVTLSIIWPHGGPSPGQVARLRPLFECYRDRPIGEILDEAKQTPTTFVGKFREWRALELVSQLKQIGIEGRLQRLDPSDELFDAKFSG